MKIWLKAEEYHNHRRLLAAEKVRRVVNWIRCQVKFASLNDQIHRDHSVFITQISMIISTLFIQFAVRPTGNSSNANNRHQHSFLENVHYKFIHKTWTYFHLQLRTLFIRWTFFLHQLFSTKKFPRNCFNPVLNDSVVSQNLSEAINNPFRVKSFISC